MSVAEQRKPITQAEYFEGELVSEIKHEFVDGYVYAMAGASKNHERIASNINAEFVMHLKASPCESYGSDLKVKTPTGSLRYPDSMVVCEDTDESEYFTKTPTILVEVISRSTRKTDEQTKRIEYMNIPTLQEYVLIEQDYVDVTVYRKSDNWLPTHYFLGDSLTLGSIELTLSVEDIYHRVKNQDMDEWVVGKRS
jgi:Uma2 family endonuclease